jgi:hypothetical protein
VVAVVEIPESPEACSSITNPLFADIQDKITELTDFLDCIEFTTNQVCAEVDAAVSNTLSDNIPRLEAKGGEVVAKIQRLYPVIADEGEEIGAFSERILGEFAAALDSGDADSVAADFGTPSDEVPGACAGLDVSYDDLNNLINDFTQACSFDAYL